MKQLHEYETPLTDEAEIDNSHFADYGSGPSGYVVGEFARGLERKLALCRDALKDISAIAENTARNEEDQITQNAIIEAALEAIEATEQKQ